jgi:hypothetical protein
MSRRSSRGGRRRKKEEEELMKGSKLQENGLEKLLTTAGTDKNNSRH